MMHLSPAASGLPDTIAAFAATRTTPKNSEVQNAENNTGSHSAA